MLNNKPSYFNKVNRSVRRLQIRADKEIKNLRKRNLKEEIFKDEGFIALLITLLLMFLIILYIILTLFK